MALTINQIEKAIKAKNGNVTDVADALGVSRSAIYKRINASDRLQDALKDARETIVDLAESKLRELIKEGNTAAVIFALKTIGKDRGYVERVQAEHTGKDGGAIETTVTHRYENMTDDQLKALLE